MRSIVRIILLVVCAALAAHPALACCADGPQAGAAAPSAQVGAQAEAVAPPCHSGAPIETASAPQRDEPCPPCFDCEDRLLAAAATKPFATPAGQTDKSATLASVFAHAGPAPVATVFKTGPPDRPRVPHSTPVDLHQRLLI